MGAREMKNMGQPLGYCLNTGTIRGHKLGIVEEVDVAAAAGYGAIEPWIESIEQYRQSGGSLRDLRKRIADAGLAVPSAIGFAQWLSDRSDRRAKGLEQARRDMDLVRQIGGTRIAAPAAGMTKRKGLCPLVTAERYRALLEVGDRIGVVPQLELWGFSTPLSRLGEVAMAAIETGHPKACILLDVYHIYKGGSDFEGLKLLSGAGLHVLHMDDYPAKPPRQKITDADRVYPGDGVAPLRQILRDLKAVGFAGWLSLELFNQEYYKRPALEVAKTGLAKMKAVVRQALGAGG
jgi:sugar phosphate isomerase/epimerase